jgi:hypothetical protein
MVVGKKLRAVLAGTILLIIVASLAVFLSAPRQTTPTLQATTPSIEEHHYIMVTVKTPDNITQTHTYETKSFVYTEVLMIRMLSEWIYVSFSNVYRSFISYTTTLKKLNSSGYYVGTAPPGQLYDIDYWCDPPSLVFLGSGSSNDGGQTLGNTLGVSAVPSIGYAYNDVWFNVTISATFSLLNAATVSEAMLATKIDITPIYASIIYDSFPAVGVPAGGSLTIQWVLAWKDYGAFTENWGKFWQRALTLCGMQAIDATDDTGTVMDVRWLHGWPPPTVALAWGAGTSPMSRSSYKLEQEEGSVEVGYAIHGSGFSIGGALGSQASEVGLYWIAYCNDGNMHRFLLMRWVPGYELPAGTPVNIYVAKGG